MENLVFDSFRLINKILSDTYEENVLVHISQSELLTYSFPRSPEIRTCYGYVIDRTPDYLEKVGILKILIRDDYVLPYNRFSTYESLKKFYSKIQKSVSENYTKFTGEMGDFSRFGFFSPKQKNISESSGRGLCYVVINRERAKKWIDGFKKNDDKKVNNPEERPYWYENKQLFFRLSNGSIDQLDFAKANVSRRIFETFWFLWTDGKGEYEVDEILKKYKDVNKIDIDSGKIGELVGNIRDKIIKPKINLRDRIIWEYNKSSKRWTFKII